MIDTTNKVKDRKTQYQQLQSLPKALQIPLQQTPIPKHSTYAEAYHKIMSTVPLIKTHQDLEKQAYFNYNTFFCPGIHSKIINKNGKYNIYQLKVYFSYFQFDLYINFYEGSPQSIFYLPKIGQGGFGAIYKYGDTHAIKNTQFTEKNKAWIIRKVIEEYCFYQASSHMKVGPKVTRLFGFDLIVYKDCIQFSMERCLRPIDLDKNELLQSIKLLHQFKIIHGDIKNDNIMYSRSFEKNILIDFNCSSVISENVGEKTLTLFKGTVSKCSDEMSALYMKKKPKEVDLYYNDVFSWNLIDTEVSSSDFKWKPPQQDNISKCEMQEFIIFMRHMNLRFLLFQDNFEQIAKYMEEHALELLPSKKIEDSIQIKIGLYNRTSVKLHHSIYAKIIKIILQTYEIARNTNFKRNLKRTQFISNFFRNYIGLQGVTLKLKEEKETIEDYINFSDFNANKTYTSEITKTLWVNRIEEIEFGSKNVFFDVEKALEQLKTPEISQKQIKGLYYDILKNKPTKDQLKEAVMATFFKIGLKHKTETYEIKEDKICILKELESGEDKYIEGRLYPCIMMDIDQYFKKGKYWKNRLWKDLKGDRTNSKNFIARIIAELCTIDSASNRLFKVLFAYNIKGFINDIQILRITEMRIKTRKLFENITYRLIRVLRDVTQQNKEQLIELEKAIKAASIGEAEKIYLDNVELLKYYIHHQTNSLTYNEIQQLDDEQNYDQIWLKRNLNPEGSTPPNIVHTSYIIQQKIIEGQIYTRIAKNIPINVQELKYLLNLLDASQKQQINHLCRIVDFLIYLNIQKCIIKPEITLTVLKHYSHYFCAFEVSQLSSVTQIRCCKEFNEKYFGCYSLLLPKKGAQFEDLYQKYISWLERQYINEQYPLTVYTSLLSVCDYHQDAERYDFLQEQMNKIFSVFETIDHWSLFSPVLMHKRNLLYREAASSFTWNPCEMQIYLDRLIYFQKFDEIVMILFYFRLNKDYHKIFQTLKVCIKYSQNHKYEQLMNLIAFLNIFRCFIGIKPLNDEIVDPQFILYHSSNILSLKNLPPSLAIINLQIAVSLPYFFKTIQSSCTKLACLSYIEQCLIAIFKHVEECPRFMRQRIKQNIGRPLKAIYQARKNFPSEQLSSPTVYNEFDRKLYQNLRCKKLSPAQYISQFSFKFAPLKNISLKSLNIYHLRRSLLNKRMPSRKELFIQICEKLCSFKKVQNHRIQKLIKKKFMKLIENKFEDVKASLRQCFRHSNFLTFKNHYLNCAVV